MKTITHWVDGRLWSGDSRTTTRVWNPATGKQSAEVLLANEADVDAAVKVATKAFEDWSQSSLSRRTKVLFSFREIVAARIDELAETISDEHGKVVSDAKGEVQRGLEVVEFACGIPQLLKGDYSDQVSNGIDMFSYRQPLGVVTGITPFNFPAMVPMWMYPIAIACGNTFVLKPSERDPSVSLKMAEIWSDAGLPSGVFNVINGDVVAVNALLSHPGISAVSFVGSTPIAHRIHDHASASGKRIQALGGAKNHSIVLPDADMDFAAEHIVAAAFGSAGERCMAISAAIVISDFAEPLLSKIINLARNIKVGPGSDRLSEMGPIVSPEAKARIVGLIDSGEAQGATVTLDGRGFVVPGHEGGFFVGPTILDNVTAEMDVYRSEIFGPVLTVLRAASVDDAIGLINSNVYGNGAAIFTSSGEAARRFHRDAKVGMIGINVPIPVPMAYYSFGGWKDSLIGEHHIHGAEGVAFYTRGKVITSRWPKPKLSSGASYSFPVAN